MMWWFSHLDNGVVTLHVDDENLTVKGVRAGKYLMEIDILLDNGLIKTLKLDQYKTDDGVNKLTKRRAFVKTWAQHLPGWQNTETQESKKSEDGDATAVDECNIENIPPVIAGCHEIFLKENYRGTYAVHINNLIAPQPKHRTRVLDNSHVSELVDSLRSTSMGQLVVMLGLIDKEIDPASLAEPGQGFVECLGGNHTRQAMQTLFDEGTLPYSTVQVRLYSQLSREMVLSLGYAHNTVTHERNKLVGFIDKVRLMRELLPPNPDKEAILVWKNALSLIFRKENVRKLQQFYAVHLLMARLPEPMWNFIVSATANMNITQRFFVDCMKLKPEFAEEALSFLTKGEKIFKMEVKKMLADESKLKISKKKKTAEKKESPDNEGSGNREHNDVFVTGDTVIDERGGNCEEPEPEDDQDNILVCLKRKLAQMGPENERLMKENSMLQKELVAVKAENQRLITEKSSLQAEVAGFKRKQSSVVTDESSKKMQKKEEFVEKQLVWAYFKEMDTSYPAQILNVGKELIEVKWLEDDKVRELDFRHVKLIDSVKEKAIRKEFSSKLLV